MTNLRYIGIFLALGLMIFAGTSHSQAKSTELAPLIKYDYKPGELTELCQSNIDDAKKAIDTIVLIPKNLRTLQNTLLAFEKLNADFSDSVNTLTFMNYVSMNKNVSAESANCADISGQFGVEMVTRRDIYEVLVDATPTNDAETRLLKETLEGFEHSGLKLSDEALGQVRDLKTKLASLETQFSTNLNKDQTTVLFSIEELEGLPSDYMASLKRTDAGLYIVNTKESDYPIISHNAVRSETRRKMLVGYLNRGGEANLKLLTGAVALRAHIAKLLGYKTWADYQIEQRMAKDGTTVLAFLNGLKNKLAKRTQSDLAKILKFKLESVPDATQLDQWDIGYYSYQLQKRDYSLDDEKIKEFFPADVVVAGMFQIYSKMLGVYYTQVKNAPTWSPDVNLYEIHNAKDARLIGYFFTDFIPREGKYDHAAAFPLISGRVLPNGNYNLPISSIVANLSPPLNGKPSLLDHDDVETIFHEFGHIMHQTLTRAPYASLSGSAVAQDFVEAPSQMLENWVWNADIVNMLSGHYLDHSQKFPPELLKQIIAARDFNLGYGYTVQLLYSLFDMTLHTQDGPIDVNQTYLDLYKQIVGINPVQGQMFPASFGHIMGGYDAGYYGYLWSAVYAQDMFTQFPTDNLTSPEVGARYRKFILEQGNMKDAIDILREFLGREPNSDAFFKKLGIQ